eukprot:TRINITY_DN27620_c0_g1_i1.p1 TRINITY_DN27620_c0_g1~~TRINITY_DN27620_c0_g1_i1.p1  ORF type:complete len:108 (+),score=36.93 TRINITY_DN27620_c0_g1_i1:3-326(+)
MRSFLFLFALVAVASAASPAPRFNEKTLKCDVCQFLFEKINDSLLTEENAGDAIAQLETICSQLQESSSFLGETCDKFVEEIFKPEIEDILANKPEPLDACKELNFC